MKYYPKVDNIQIPSCSMYDYMYSKARRYKKNTAIEYFGVKITYEQMFLMIEKTARALKQFGIKEGDTVSICSVSTPEVVYSIYAINRIGAIANMIDPRNSITIMNNILVDSDTKILIVTDLVENKFETILEGTQVEKVIAFPLFNALPKWKRTVIEKLKPDFKAKINASDKVIRWNDFLIHAKEYGGDIDAEYDENRTAAIAYTGGTTGEPKGVKMSNRALNAAVISNSFVDYRVTAGDRVLSSAPTWTFYGFSNSLNTYFAEALTVILWIESTPEGVAKGIAKTKPNMSITVPSALPTIMKSKFLKRKKLDYFRTMIVGADKLTTALENEFNDWLAARGSSAVVTQGYGMTETLAASAYTSLNVRKPGIAGIPYILNTITCFKELEEGYVECKYNEQGEICITGPTLMQGYFGFAEGNTNDVLKVHEDGITWAHTGDIGHIDEDGCLYVDGRIKRMFARNGYKIFPGTIEEAIAKHENVDSCAVISAPDEVNGLAIIAYIVLKSDDSKTIEQIEEIVAEKLPDYERPQKYITIEKMPLTGMQKIDYRALEEIYKS